MTIKLDNGASINYEVYGTGKRLLILHGWGEDIRIFDQITTALSQNFQLILLDLPGFGRSSSLPYPFALDDYTLTVERFLTALEINEVFVLGHSFGGAIAIKLATFSNKVKRLILEDSSGIRNKDLMVKLKICIYKTFKLILNEKYREKLRHIIGSPDYRSTGVLRSTFVKIVNEDIQYKLSKINLPTLLIWGRNDKETPIAQAEVMRDKIKNSKLLIIENAGHFPHLDKPEEFIKAIKEFLED